MARRPKGPAPFDYKQYGYAFGGPIPGAMFKDKLFFFGAQEWVDFFQVETRNVDGADRSRCGREISASCWGPNRFFSTPQIIRDPVTGQAFPNNVIPSTGCRATASRS